MAYPSVAGVGNKIILLDWDARDCHAVSVRFSNLLRTEPVVALTSEERFVAGGTSH